MAFRDATRSAERTTVRRREDVPTNSWRRKMPPEEIESSGETTSQWKWLLRQDAKRRQQPWSGRRHPNGTYTQDVALQTNARSMIKSRRSPISEDNDARRTSYAPTGAPTAHESSAWMIPRTLKFTRRAREMLISKPTLPPARVQRLVRQRFCYLIDSALTYKCFGAVE